LPETLIAADMLVHASMWEGLPRAVVQGLLLEIPAVSFDLDGAPEVVLPGRTGLLISPGDSTVLAQAGIDLASDKERSHAFGRAGRELCLTRFDWRRMVEQIESLYVDARRSH